jgi:hypothetical protein
MSEHFVRKNYSRDEINLIIAEQLQLCIEPICKELGRAMEGLQRRIVDLEMASNSMIAEMKEWKKKNQVTLQ